MKTVTSSASFLLLLLYCSFTAVLGLTTAIERRKDSSNLVLVYAGPTTPYKDSSEQTNIDMLCSESKSTTPVNGQTPEDAAKTTQGWMLYIYNVGAANFKKDLMQKGGLGAGNPLEKAWQAAKSNGKITHIVQTNQTTFRSYASAIQNFGYFEPYGGDGVDKNDVIGRKDGN